MVTGKLTPEEEMHAFLTGNYRVNNMMRRVFSHVPSGPNCKICAAPFAGPGGAVLRHLGSARFAVAAGQRLLASAGRADGTPSGPIPIGAAVHTGNAFVGSTTTKDVVSGPRLAALRGQDEPPPRRMRSNSRRRRLLGRPAPRTRAIPGGSVSVGGGGLWSM